MLPAKCAPSIFVIKEGFRVKTLASKKFFGGYIKSSRPMPRKIQNSFKRIRKFPSKLIICSLLILYPFEKTVASGAPEQDINRKN